MKKVLCLTLAFAMLACCFPAFAEIADVETTNRVVINPDEPADISEISKALESAEEIAAPERPASLDQYKKEINGEETDPSRAVTGDSVFISGNSYTVMLPGALTFHYTAPSNVLVLTQDIIQQSSLYSNLYQNPKQICDSFIQEGMHLNLYDINTKTDMYFYVYCSSLANVYSNANNLTEQEAVYIINYLGTMDDYFRPCTEAIYGYAGGNVWLIGDARSTVQKLFLCTFVNGLEVWGVVPAKTDAEYNAVIDMLDTLVIN